MEDLSWFMFGIRVR